MAKSTHIRVDLELFNKLKKKVEIESKKKKKDVSPRTYLETLLKRNLAKM